MSELREKFEKEVWLNKKHWADIMFYPKYCEWLEKEVAENYISREKVKEWIKEKRFEVDKINCNELLSDLQSLLSRSKEE